MHVRMYVLMYVFMYVCTLVPYSACHMQIEEARMEDNMFSHLRNIIVSGKAVRCFTRLIRAHI